jgi:hypothetical protein
MDRIVPLAIAAGLAVLLVRRLWLALAGNRSWSERWRG